jgi:hypothetical protein
MYHMYTYVQDHMYTVSRNGVDTPFRDIIQQNNKAISQATVWHSDTGVR